MIVKLEQNGKQGKYMREIKIGRNNVLVKLDTGADKTCVNANSKFIDKKDIKKNGKEKRILVKSADDKIMKCLGTVKMWIDDKLEEVLVIEGLARELLIGCDLIEKNRYLKEEKKQEINMIQTEQIAQISKEDEMKLKILEKKGDHWEDMKNIIKRNIQVFDDSKVGEPSKNIRPVEIRVKKNITPTKTVKPEKIPIAWEKEVKAMHEEKLKKGIIRPSNSKVISTTKTVMKKKFPLELRQTGSYIRVNKYIEDMNTNIPSIQRILQKIAGYKYYSQYDAKVFFWQIPLAENSKYLTSYVDKFGQWEYNVLPQGVKIATQESQERTNEIFGGIENTETYVDNIFIYSNTIGEHKKAMEEVFDRAKKNNVKFNMKPVICSSNMKAVGYKVSETGIEIHEDGMQPIRDLQPPTTREEVMHTRGILGVNRDLIPRYADYDLVLIELQKPNKEFVWKEEHQEAFDTLKKLTLESKPLKGFDDTKQVILRTDVSNGKKTWGATLYQDHGVISYASGKFDATYAPTKSELYGFKKATEKFDLYLRGRKFIWEMDCKALQNLETLKGDIQGHMLRWANDLTARYDFETKWIEGKEMGITDNFTRANIQHEVEKVVEIEQITVQQVIQEQNKENIIAMKECEGIKMNQNGKIIVPKLLKEDIIMDTHIKHGHLSQENTVKKIKEYFWWENMTEEIKQEIKKCDLCARNKIRTQGVNVEDGRIEANENLEVISIDTIGKLKTTKKKNEHLLMMMDVKTKFVKMVPIARANAKTVKETLKEKWFEALAKPKKIIADSAKIFTISKEIKQLCEENGILMAPAPPRHQNANPCERAWQTIQIRLALLEREHKMKEWDELIVEAVEQYNHMMNKKGITPYEALLGITMRVKESELEKLVTKQKEQNTSEKHKFKVGDSIFVKNSVNYGKGKSYTNARPDRAFGPYRIGKLIGDHLVELMNGSRKHVNEIFMDPTSQGSGSSDV